MSEAEEMVAYNMPGFAIGGTVVASYAAFSKNCGLYLLAGAITEHADEIAALGLKASKTGITFSPTNPSRMISSTGWHGRRATAPAPDGSREPGRG
ncbi:hypothetical protein [Tessaracoccus terricola]